MTGISGIAACVLGSLTFTLAPVPKEAAPDPLARGYIGVWFTNQSLAIDRVEPGLPGAKAGLQAGDVIVRVGTLEPQVFDQVVAHICSFRPGAVVEVEVQRGSERKTFKVTLAARPPDDANAPGRPRPVPIDD